MKDDAHPSPTENFIEQMGIISQREGGPRIAGRISGLLTVEGRPLSLQEIAERLKVSRASVSTNARMLAERGLLRLTSQPGDRQDYYERVPNAHKQIMASIADRMRHAALEIAEAESRFPPDDAGAKERIHQLAEFYRVSATFIDEWTARLEANAAVPATKR